ncbi:MAG: type II toxin-antitoxin system HicB family antitoxin [Treponema sp.]|nr:type II toxin-antitoxin system HicB family antitoxin [Treponema sp.]
MKNSLSYKGFYGSVEFSDEDNIFFGRIIGINDHITYEGDSVKSLRKDFNAAVDEYINVCAELGKEPEKPYKGSFNVRIEPVLHRQLVIYSTSHGKSLNSVVSEAISNYVC